MKEKLNKNNQGSTQNTGTEQNDPKILQYEYRSYGYEWYRRHPNAYTNCDANKQKGRNESKLENYQVP